MNKDKSEDISLEFPLGLIQTEQLSNKHPYDEVEAQRLLALGDLNNVIVYCLPTINGYLKKHPWGFISSWNYEDIHQELAISVINSVKSYKIEAKVKLFTWLYTNFRFTCLTLNKKDHLFNDKFRQLDEIADDSGIEPEQSQLFVPPVIEVELPDPKPEKPKRIRKPGYIRKKRK